MPTRNSGRWVLVGLLIAVWLGRGVDATAQGASAGSLDGRVSDQTGAALPGVTVELQPVDASRRVVYTDATGAYLFEDVPPGRVRLWFRLVNFAEVIRDVEVPSSGAVSLDVRLFFRLTADLVVTGSRTFRNLAETDAGPGELLGIAATASQGVVTARQLDARPLARAGDVLETVPGMIVSQHSGEGKGNQLYLRGFNLDHGTDFATTVAGVPVNLPTHAHGHGYTDLNFLIPELVSGVQYRKGPYFAENGDFSAAGSSRISYLTELDAPIARFSGGEDGWGRLVAAASPQVGDGVLLAALELNRNDGPWDEPDAYRRLNAVGRYSRGDRQNGMSITALAHTSQWEATDQIPTRAVEAGSVSRFGDFDPTLGGDTERYALSADVVRSGGPGVTRASGFVQRYALNLFSNFTYFLDDPVSGDQFEQADRRWVSGGRISHRRLVTWLGRHVEAAFGAQLRHDDIGQVGLYRTNARRRVSVTRDDVVGHTSAGLYGDAEIEWSPHVRSVLGLRGDLYWFDVASSDPRNGGQASDALVSPKASLILGPWRGTELYVNGGLGFHSNDARGTTIAVDPRSGRPADRVTPLVEARGAEVGLRTVAIPHMQSTLTLWTLALDSELLFVGDAGATEASRPSRRYGVEWTNYVQLQPWLFVDVDLALTEARFSNADPAGDRIPGAPDVVASLGVTMEDRQGFSGSLRLRHFGSRPLVEDDRVRSEATTLVNLQAGYRLTSRLRVVVDVFNLFDAEASDIDYFYASRLPGEPVGGIEDVHFHPTLPRTLRMGLQLGF